MRAARRQEWLDSPVLTYLFVRPESPTNASESPPWWRGCWGLGAVALATAALFLPVLR
jgi:hypothetical protein